HLAGFDADQVVSRSPRDGNRDGHHGLWRWRDDRGPARQSADAIVQDAVFTGRVADIPCNGGDLFRVHDGWRIRLPAASAGMASTGLDSEGRRADDFRAPGAFARRTQDQTILADLGCAVPERICRHRRAWYRFTHVAGDIRRPADRPARCAVYSAE